MPCKHIKNLLNAILHISKETLKLMSQSNSKEFLYHRFNVK